jgi:hypothetical protein
VGYAFPFDPAHYTDKKKVREALGYDVERPLGVCAVGGTAVGVDLLRLCATAYPHIQERVRDVRMVLVCGPRIDPAHVQAPSGVEVRGTSRASTSTSPRAIGVVGCVSGRYLGDGARCS